MYFLTEKNIIYIPKNCQKTNQLFMNSIIFPKIATNTNTNSDNSTTAKNDYKDLKNPNSFKPFKAFSSALFMSEYQENEDTFFCSNSNSSSNKGIKNKTILDLTISPSLEKCLTNELLESMADESSNIKGSKNYDNNMNAYEQGNGLKITKKLFEQNKINNNDKEKKIKGNENTLYEENSNGFEYQLKFIENSVHNILPQSYKKNNKKSFYNNNNYSYNKNNHRTSFPYSNKYRNNNNYNYNKNENEKYFYSNDKPSFAKIYYPNLINKNNEDNGQNNYFPDNKNVKNQILFQIQKVKANENDYDDWKCNNCDFLNRGYRKVCAKCNIYRQK